METQDTTLCHHMSYMGGRVRWSPFILSNLKENSDNIYIYIDFIHIHRIINSGNWNGSVVFWFLFLKTLQMHISFINIAGIVNTATIFIGCILLVHFASNQSALPTSQNATSKETF